MTEGNGCSKESSGIAGGLSTDPVPFMGTGLTGLVEMEFIGIMIRS